MKEAIIIDLNGFYVEPTLVANSVTGVFPIEEYVVPEGGDEPTKVTTGYTVAIDVPGGLYKPKFDLDAETWGEGLSRDEIDELTKFEPVVTDSQRIAELESQVEALQAENVDLMIALVEADERAEANNTDAMLAIIEADERAAQDNLDTMLAVVELCGRVEELASALSPEPIE